MSFHECTVYTVICPPMVVTEINVVCSLHDGCDHESAFTALGGGVRGMHLVPRDMYPLDNMCASCVSREPKGGVHGVDKHGVHRTCVHAGMYTGKHRAA